LRIAAVAELAKFCNSVLLVQPTVVHELNDILLSTRVSEKLP